MKLKYKKGRLINSAPVLIRLVESGEWAMLHGKPKHPAIFLGMTFRTVLKLIKEKKIHKAKANK